MLPYVLTKRPVPKPAPPKRPAVTKTEAPVVTSYPDSDEDSGDGDFFSLSSHVPAEPAEINLEDLLPPTLGPSAKPRLETVAITETRVEATWEEAGGSSSSWQPPQEDSIEPPDADLQLDEAAVSQTGFDDSNFVSSRFCISGGRKQIPLFKSYVVKITLFHQFNVKCHFLFASL